MIRFLEAAVIAGGIGVLIPAQWHKAAPNDPPGRSRMATFHIALSGSPDVAFDGSCWVRSDARETEFPLTGTVPMKREFAGEALRCQIRQVSAEGHLDVELTSSGGNRTHSRTQGAGSTIALSVR